MGIKVDNSVLIFRAPCNFRKKHLIKFLFNKMKNKRNSLLIKVFAYHVEFAARRVYLEKLG